MWLSLGGFQEKGPDPSHIHNTHVVLEGGTGRLVAAYRKVRIAGSCYMRPWYALPTSAADPDVQVLPAAHELVLSSPLYIISMLIPAAFLIPFIIRSPSLVHAEQSHPVMVCI